MPRVWEGRCLCQHVLCEALHCSSKDTPVVWCTSTQHLQMSYCGVTSYHPCVKPQQQPTRIGTQPAKRLRQMTRTEAHPKSDYLATRTGSWLVANKPCHPAEMLLSKLPQLHYISKPAVLVDGGSCQDTDKNKTEVQTRLFLRTCSTMQSVTWPLCLSVKSHGLCYLQ